MTEPITFHHATCATLPGLAFHRRGRWLFLPLGDGPLHVVQPTDHLILHSRMPLPFGPLGGENQFA